MQLLSALVQRLKGLSLKTISLDGKQYMVADSIELVIHGKGRKISKIKFYVGSKEIYEVDIDWTGDLYNDADTFHLKLPHVKTLLELE